MPKGIINILMGGKSVYSVRQSTGSSAKSVGINGGQQILAIRFVAQNVINMGPPRSSLCPSEMERGQVLVNRPTRVNRKKLISLRISAFLYITCVSTPLIPMRIKTIPMIDKAG